MNPWIPDINRTRDTNYARRDPMWGGARPGSCLELVGWLLGAVVVLGPFIAVFLARL